MNDKGLRKAIGQQPKFRMPSNFNYRLMQKIEAEVHAREKRQEKRLRLLLTITIGLMSVGSLGYVGWCFGGQLLAFGRTMGTLLTPTPQPGFDLPIVCAFLLLFAFNWWLRKFFSRYMQK